MQLMRILERAKKKGTKKLLESLANFSQELIKKYADQIADIQQKEKEKLISG